MRKYNKWTMRWYLQNHPYQSDYFLSYHFNKPEEKLIEKLRHAIYTSTKHNTNALIVSRSFSIGQKVNRKLICKVLLAILEYKDDIKPRKKRRKLKTIEQKKRNIIY